MLKLCDKHWEGLIFELYTRNLISLVPDTSDEARKRWEASKVQLTKENFEPIFMAGFAIVYNASKQGGVNTSEKGEVSCPICADHSREDWVSFAADDCLREAYRLGVLIDESGSKKLN